MSEATSLPSGLTGVGTGGNSLEVDLNSQFDLANMAWVGVAAILVWIMVPGIGLLYSGLSRKKHALSLLWASLMAASLVSFQWFFWGYSLVFSHNVYGEFLGSLQFIGMRNVLGAPSVVSALPDTVFAFFQGMFACVTGSLMIGGACERARLGPMMVFLFIWITIVYCPVACWTWNPEGWLAKLGGLDYAGGGPVHITSGHGALIYALVLGKRNDPVAGKGLPKYKPHSVTSVVLGTVFLWFGWFGFNGGSAGTTTIRAWFSNINTNVAASCAALTWMFIDYFRSDGKWTTVGLCSGAIAGLVGITPGAGFVPIWASMIIGIITATACNFAVDLKNILKIDDGLDVYALHGVGGSVGCVLTGIFAADYVTALDGTEIAGGWLNHHWKQVGYQLAGMCAIIGWTCVVTAIILLVQDRIPFLRLRLHADEEELGTDQAEIGEFTYNEEQQYIPEPVRSNASKNPPAKPALIDDHINNTDATPSPNAEKNTENSDNIV
ncbi:ammonium permease MEP2 [Cyberlindnera jadinii NRRL Y-1542]|uniref:Ammonium transporter n=1 Tax=Cyberlindnera jadinii (strain ATCC 18201 / CBS 1600 / BCRC 20928 / JCM 3617 / NBRC 0987 / NRRL Y-1542) TaxID=983966 RepID=A0A1E4S5R7_CYBJN|nr:ammonium transporter [Cyberlindnera jadinii NRRL Y-1542]ODV74810.1 ammonium transporter [Cyberlindnera jadinii NRRL Y-1542]